MTPWKTTEGCVHGTLGSSLNYSDCGSPERAGVLAVALGGFSHLHSHSMAEVGMAPPSGAEAIPAW